MTENLVSGPILARFVPNLVPQISLVGFNLLDVGNSCKLSLYDISRKTNEPTWENNKKPSFEPDFGPNLVPKDFFL